MTKHKVFISYYHKDDESYRNRFEELFGDLFINKSVKLGDISDDLSTDYIKRLIREDYISDSSVVLILVGKNTYCRKHVDWEIYAGLYKNAGLLSLVLPTHTAYNTGKYSENNIPARLYDNLNSEYASIDYWTENREKIKKLVNTAFENRKLRKNNKINSRKQMKKNRCE